MGAYGRKNLFGKKKKYIGGMSWDDAGQSACTYHCILPPLASQRITRYIYELHYCKILNIKCFASIYICDQVEMEVTCTVHGLANLYNIVCIVTKSLQVHTNKVNTHWCNQELLQVCFSLKLTWNKNKRKKN